MATPTYEVSCIKNVNIAREIYELEVTKPDGFSFQPGQFILFDVPLTENPDDIQPRAYSIASSPSEDTLRFVFKLKEGGRASKWISNDVREGSSITMKGPFGRFVLKDTDPPHRVLVGTSTGIAPFVAMAKQLASEQYAGRVDLIMGVRHEDDLFWKEELEALAQESANIFTHIALSQPSDEWRGHKGRVQTLLPLIAPDLSQSAVYLCGNPPMVKELKKLCLEEWGVEKGNLKAEEFI